MLAQTLEEFGLSANEVTIYITLLKMGEASAQHVARQAGIARTTTYHLLDALANRALVSVIEKEGIKSYRAAPPEQMLARLDDQRRKIREILPELHALMHTIKEKPSVVVFEGVRGVKAVLEDVLTSKGEILTYGDLDVMLRAMQFAFPQFIRSRVRRRIPIRIIGKRIAAHAEQVRSAKKEFRQFVFIPPQYTLPTNCFFYNGKVAILSIGTEPYHGIIIENKEFCDTQKFLFELLWTAYGPPQP